MFEEAAIDQQGPPLDRLLIVSVRPTARDSQRGKVLMKLVQVREGRAVDEVVAGIFTKMSSDGL